MNEKTWSSFGEAIGQSTSLKHLQIMACNLHIGENLEGFMNGVSENSYLEKLEITDCMIEDINSISIVRYIKKMTEHRDSAIWKMGLR